MLARLNPVRILGGVLDGLRKRSRDNSESADIGARLLLFGAPLAVSGTLIAFRIVINEPEVTLAAVALLIGALLAGFSQVASWRERILEKGRRVDAERIKALNAAGALILLSIHVSVVASGAVFGVALLEIMEPPSPSWLKWTTIILSSVGPGGLAFVGLSLVLVANLLWDGFASEQDDIEREGLEEFSSKGD